MKYRNFKPFGSISALTLGGGGIGNVWGKTTRKEAVDTVLYAIDSGINHLDMAPMYGRGEAELVVGEALKKETSKLKLQPNVSWALFRTIRFMKNSMNLLSKVLRE